MRKGVSQPSDNLMMLTICQAALPNSVQGRAGQSMHQFVSGVMGGCGGMLEHLIIRWYCLSSGLVKSCQILSKAKTGLPKNVFVFERLYC